MSTASSFDGIERKPKGAVLFTGPDGVSNYRTHIEDQFHVGHGTLSVEATSDTLYLCRAAPGCPHPPPKTARVGEIGWGVPKLSDNSLLKSGDQIKLKEFRQATEDRHTHLYQTPYYPPPSATHQENTPRSLQERPSLSESLSQTSNVYSPMCTGSLQERPSLSESLSQTSNHSSEHSLHVSIS